MSMMMMIMMIQQRQTNGRPDTFSLHVSRCLEFHVLQRHRKIRRTAQRVRVVGRPYICKC